MKYTGSASLTAGTTYKLNIYDGGRYWANASAGTATATTTQTMYRYGSGGSGDGITITPAFTGTYSFEWTLNTAGNREDAGSFKVTFPSTYTITVRQYKGTSGTTVKAGTVKIGDTSVTTSGGTAQVPPSTATATKITAPTGYTVYSASGAGWSRTSGDSGTTEWNGTVTASAADILTVYYQPKTTTVTLNKNADDAVAGTPSVTATYDAAMPTTSVTMPTRTGYNFAGYYDTSASSGGTRYYTAAGASARAWNVTDSSKTLYARWTAKTSALTFDYTTNGGSNTGRPTGKTATYGSAMPSITSSQLPATRTGYTFLGIYDAATGGTQYYTNTGASARNWDKNTTSGTTLYAQWEEVTGGIALTAYTDGSASTTGGHIENGSGTTITSLSGIGIGTKGTAVSVTSGSSYAFAGWEKAGDNASHIKIYTNEACTTEYTSGATTTVYIKTDGTDGLTTDNAIVKANFVNNVRTVTVGTMLAIDGTGYKTSNATDASFNPVSGGGSYTISPAQSFNPTATEPAGYKFIGWIKSATPLTTAAMNTTPAKTTLAYGSTTMTTGVDTYYYALYKKVYHISLYNTTEKTSSGFRYLSGPPMRVTATPTGGSAVTYTYKKNANATSEGSTRTSGDYNEGDLLTVYAGDTIVLTYSALSSSETITGVFFNNDRRYTCESENDNLYKLREFNANGYATGGDDDWEYDYLASTTLYANENYYEDPIKSTIIAQKANYQAKDGVDNNTHTVTFVAKSDYLNIDLELAQKRQFIFTDETGLDIRSEMLDNYYNPLSEVSASSATTKFGIKLASSDTCAYAWGTGDKVKFYRDAACTNEVTGVFTVASSADANGYFVISGIMPNYNVYVKPNIVTNYNLYLGGRMISDTFGNFDSPGDVAYYYVNNSTGANHLLTGKADTTNTSASAVAQGTTVQLSFTFKTRAQMGWSGTGSAPADMYSFIGWYKGTADGPDYSNGKISTKDTFNFIPKANTYIYAVTTRDVYINGSKNITGATTDWNTKNSVDQNFLMSFDPDYINPEGGLRGRYYWVVETAWFNASGTGGVGDFQMGSYQSDNVPYWNNNNSNHGNSFFQIRDEATGGNKSLWTGIEPYVSDKSYIKFGKIDPRDLQDHTVANADGLGVIKFKESDSGSKGYTSPITIYYYPGHGFSVEPTPVFSNLYVSNGFTVGGTTNNTNDTSVTAGTGESFTVSTSGSGWPTNIEDKDYVEGTVKHYIPEKKNAKVKISKTVSSTEKVVAFDIYDLDNDKFYSRTDVTASSNTYSIELQVTMQQNLYIIPIIQEKSADLTFNFDGSQLNKAQWGDIVCCYAWYGNGRHNGANNYDALGAYPGQPMIVSDDGNTWTTAIPSKKTIGGTEYTLSGILFSNFVDGERSWLGRSGVMGTEQNAGTQSISTSGGIITQYNIMKDTDYRKNDTTGEYQYYGTYNKANFKAQTYDYREPVAIYNNAPKGEGVKTTITFAMKDGDSSLISWRHSELTGNNILNLPSGWTPLRWEYLTNSTGKKYSDLNGQPMEGKPTATYYIAAKGQVIYKDDSMTKVYYGGKDSDAPSPAVSYGLSGTSIDFNYAVQWYVYDAQGNYITNVLSAAFADQKDGMSYIAKQLDDLGYAVDGKSVAICYDKPRYMFTDDGGVINSGTNFDAYRFEGQWYATVTTEPVTVSVGVGMMTENGEVIADNNHPGYGDAYAEYDTTYGMASSYFTPVVDGDKSVTVALADANKRIVKLHAKEQNFVGWYYYDVNTGEFTKASYTSHLDFFPNFNADVTYYAIYEARAVYQYNYEGRESVNGSKTKTYSVDGGAMSDKEMDGTDSGSNGANTVSKTTRDDFTTKSPTASDVKIFKKDIEFKTVTSDMLDNGTQYIMNITNAIVTDAKFTITAHYKKADGSGLLTTKAENVTYNTPVDFTTLNEGSALPSVYAGHKFIGWYACDASGNISSPHMLLSTQANYGMVAVKDQHILAVYDDNTYEITSSDTNAFTLYVDDHEITREKYSATSGTYYNDTIVRLRNDSTGNLTSLPNNAEVGILVINANDSGQSTVVSNQSNLINFANGLENGQTAAVGTKGRTVTKVSTTSLNTFGRADLAVRSDYASADGKAYSVYAYYKDSSGKYTFVTVRESGTYTIA